MNNQEIINAIVDEARHSFVDKDNTTRFCLSINEDKKETVNNALLHTGGVKELDLKRLQKEGLVLRYFLDDMSLHISIKNSFLSDKQRAESIKENEKSLARQAEYEKEEAKKKHADKCVTMHDELLSAVQLMRDALGGKGYINKQSTAFVFGSNKTCYTILNNLIKKAEQK